MGDKGKGGPLPLPALRQFPEIRPCLPDNALPPVGKGERVLFARFPHLKRSGQQHGIGQDDIPLARRSVLRAEPPLRSLLPPERPARLRAERQTAVRKEINRAGNGAAQSGFPVRGQLLRRDFRQFGGNEVELSHSLQQQEKSLRPRQFPVRLEPELLFPPIPARRQVEPPERPIRRTHLPEHQFGSSAQPVAPVYRQTVRLPRRQARNLPAELRPHASQSGNLQLQEVFGVVVDLPPRSDTAVPVGIVGLPPLVNLAGETAEFPLLHQRPDAREIDPERFRRRSRKREQQRQNTGNPFHQASRQSLIQSSGAPVPPEPSVSSGWKSFTCPSEKQ